MKRSCPDYPCFLIKMHDQAAYWEPRAGEVIFLGFLQNRHVLSDEAFENLLELTIDPCLNVYVGGTREAELLVGGICIGKLYKKDGYYWHHLFAAEKRKTISAAARAMYKKLRLHRTTII